MIVVGARALMSNKANHFSASCYMAISETVLALQKSFKEKEA